MYAVAPQILPPQSDSGTAAGRAANVATDGITSPTAGVFTQNQPISESQDVRRINDGAFTGPRGAFQRYDASPAASDVVSKPYYTDRT